MPPEINTAECDHLPCAELKFSYLAQYDLARPQSRSQQRTKEEEPPVTWSPSLRSEWRALRRRCPPAPTLEGYEQCRGRDELMPRDHGLVSRKDRLMQDGKKKELLQAPVPKHFAASSTLCASVRDMLGVAQRYFNLLSQQCKKKNIT